MAFLRVGFEKTQVLIPSLSFIGQTLILSRDMPLSPGFNMDVCSGFMAAVVTGRDIQHLVT